ncbi:MAG TPA: hypothetical protein VHZ03_30595 [Trebonia sp.]|nr:hypothetical protein [Trebonia sp.]
MIAGLAEAAPSGGSGTVTLVTGGLLALAAVVSSLTPIFLARRRARKEADAKAAAAAVSSSDLALSGWTTLNAALQQEISRLQGVVDRMQARIDLLSTELESLRKLAMGGGKSPDA